MMIMKTKIIIMVAYIGMIISRMQKIMQVGMATMIIETNSKLFINIRATRAQFNRSINTI